MNKKFVALGAALVAMTGAVWLLYTAGTLLATATPAGISIGAALAVFGAIATWLIIGQVKFAMCADRLLNLMAEEGDSRCNPDLAVSASGRVETAAAAQYRAECERAVRKSPDDWRVWFLLSVACEIARDHRGAVAALAQAATLETRRSTTSRGKLGRYVA